MPSSRFRAGLTVQSPDAQRPVPVDTDRRVGVGSRLTTGAPPAPLDHLGTVDDADDQRLAVALGFQQSGPHGLLGLL